MSQVLGLGRNLSREFDPFPWPNDNKGSDANDSIRGINAELIVTGYSTVVNRV